MRYRNPWVRLGIMFWILVPVSHMFEAWNILNFFYGAVNYLLEIGGGVTRFLSKYPLIFDAALIFCGILFIYTGNRQRQDLSPLKIEFRGRVSPFFSQFEQDGRIFQRYRVRVKNSDKAGSVNSVCLCIKSLIPAPNLLFDSRPVPLHLSNDHKEPFDQVKIFAEEHAEFYDVITTSRNRLMEIEETNFIDGSDYILQIDHAISGEGHRIRILPYPQSYEIILEASGDHVPSQSKKFVVYIRGSQLYMEEELGRRKMRLSHETNFL